MKKSLIFVIPLFLMSLYTAALAEYDENTTEDSRRQAFQQIYNEDSSEVLITIDEESGSDSAYAVDDDIWRELRRAQEYFTQGVAANQEASWEEAQYYLEQALQVLAGLDIDTVVNTPESKRYNSLLNEIVADYRLTLLSLGSLPEDASPSAFLTQFSSIKEFGDVELKPIEDEEITYNVPVVFNDKVKKSIIYFQTVGHEAFEKWLARSGKYIPLMVDILEQYDVPSDIVYLPIIESGFNCKAYSWARAVGPWQFIASTGRLYGLNRNWWYDERRDFEKSTHSAARFLRHLYEKFGSWELALAAYNGGPGRIDRTIKSQNTDNFWDMRLRKQTMDYVPFYMAATIIAKNPELYGFDVHYDDPLEWDEVQLDRCLDLKMVARATGTSLEHIQDLNPELLRNVTPPQVSNYKLRIPKDSKEKFLAELPKLESPKETSWVRHQISRGETVSSIAAKYGVSQYAILEANNLSRRSKIYAGKSLIVPVPLDGNYSRSYSEPKDRQATGDNTYIVQQGDNLWDIARSFGTSTDGLRRANYLGNSSRIYVGQVLKLPGNATNTEGPPQRDYDREPAKSTGVYRVKRGDTLWDIAKRYGTTTANLRKLNGLKRSSRIYVNQKLYVPGGDDDGASQQIYIVRRGDTLSDIARAFGTSVSRLKSLNGITDEKMLQVGTRLKISY